MLTKKISIRNVIIYMVTTIVFLAFSVSKSGIVHAAIKSTAHLPAIEQSYSKADKFVCDESSSLKLFHELLCEEECDEETEEEVQSNFTTVLLIALSQPATETTSKKVVYYSQESHYDAPVGLYTLFCSWKSNLA